ncbi:MAG TPA: pyridoxal-dependent decarboxylase, partial [Candidatus Obscuribacterales bacterium]
MQPDEFRKHAHQVVDWISDYMENVGQYPVTPRLEPGAILQSLPDAAPASGEAFEAIFADFEKLIVPGMTHWQHPAFFAYFPANASPASLLGEMLTSALGAQCMSWLTSPAATELEQRVMEWLRDLISLPPEFAGVIQDTASTATLCALLSARERASGWGINETGFQGQRYRIYASSEAHSSVEKAVRIAGLGSQNLVKVAVDENFAMIPAGLAAAIAADRAAGYEPLCVVAAWGTTGSTALDPLAEIAAICQRESLWLHVDAAYAGSALILPEIRKLAQGLELADSLVFNPHKWLLTHFDCSAYFVRDPAALERTFGLTPEYLKTDLDRQVHNYRDWGIQLGRRFRALKLWFVLRSYGVSGLQQFIRQQIAWVQELADEIQ